MRRAPAALDVLPAAVVAAGWCVCLSWLRLSASGRADLFPGWLAILGPAFVLTAFLLAWPILLGRVFWRTRPAAARVRGRIAAFTGLGALGGLLLATGNVSATSPPWICATFLAIGFWGWFLLPRVPALDRNRLTSALTGLGLLSASALLVWIDPRGLRGTYLPLDAFQWGAAMGAAGLGLAHLVEGGALRAALAGLGLAVAAGAWVAPVPEGALAVVLQEAGTVRMLRRVARSSGLLPEASDMPRAIHVDAGELFDPPVDPATVREAWRALRGAGSPPLSVVWVTIDALRTEVTGLHGGVLTPNLDALAAGGLAFERAWAQGAATHISTESMFRSRYPASRYPDPESLEAAAVAPETLDFPPLAAVLRDAGWRTVLVTGMDQAELDSRQFAMLKIGFETVIAGHGPADAEVTAEQVASALEETGDAPVFVWVHLFDPHAPYESWEESTADASPRARWEAEIERADRGLGRIVATLERSGRASRTAIVVHADHAEAFGEHGRYYHATSYFDTQIRVPLVICVPGLSPGVAQAPVENVDIAPTLLDLLGLPVPGWMHGDSLLPLLLEPGLAWPRAAFAETQVLAGNKDWSAERLRMVTDGRWKLLRYLSDEADSLFDLDADPGERRNLAAARPEVVARLLGWLEAQDRRIGRAADARAEDRPRGEHPLITGLRSGDPLVRLGAVRQIMTEGRHNLVTDLENVLGQLDDATAQQVLVLLDAALIPPPGSAATGPPLSALAGPLRQRLLRRLGSSSRCTSFPVPAPAPPLAGLEELALAEARAARGDAASAAALKRVEPGTRRLWEALAFPLAIGGDPDGVGLLLGLVRGPYPGPVLLMRVLRALGVHGTPGLGAALTAVWPSPELLLPERRYAEVVELALASVPPAELLALIALHPASTPGQRRALEERLAALDTRLTPEVIEQVGSAWVQARFGGRPEDVAAAYAAALAALPADLRPGPLSDAAEAARLLADGLPLGRLSAILEGLPSGAGESSPGPPRVRLRPEGGLPVALGTGSIAALHLSWSGPLGEAPAGILWLPPRVLVPGADLVLPVGLDHPRSPGLWRLSVRTESGEDLRTTGTCQRMIPETLDWIGPRIACDFSSGGFPLRPTRDGAALEILSGLPDQLVFPPMPAPGERLSVRVELTVWPAGDAPWIPILGSGSTTRALGRAAAGVRTTLIGEIPVPPGPLDLALRFPDRAALVDLHRISVEPAP